jgi:aminopeptidase N
VIVPTTLALSLASAALSLVPSPGAPGIGDTYFPRDGNGGIDVLHYDVHDAYAFGTGRLSGRTRLDVRATQDLSRFDLDFLLPVRSVTVNGHRAGFRQVGDHELRITPSTALAAGSQFRVSVTYAGRPATERSEGERSWLASPDEVVAMNEPHMATWWFPANDHPSDKAGFDIRITVPRHRDVIANGVLVSKHERHGRTTVHWRETQPMATYLAFFAAGSFAVSRSRCNGVPNIFAVSRKVRQDAPSKAARAWARQTCRTITALAGVLGPYPFASMGGLATSLPVSFSLENQTRPTYPALALAAQPGLMTHELAHQWFGDLVSVAHWRDIWLNEGFASFLADYSVELGGGLAMRQWLDQTYQSLVDDKEFWALPIDDPGARHLFDGPVYLRGEMAVQALRQRIGDAAFFGLLRTWLAQHAYGNGSVADFESLAESVSGQDLASFFDAWLHEPAPPPNPAT